MATKSILKDIYIRDKVNAHKLINALENASKKSSKDVTLKKKYSEVRGEDIKKFFGGSKCQDTAE